MEVSSRLMNFTITNHPLNTLKPQLPGGCRSLEFRVYGTVKGSGILLMFGSPRPLSVQDSGLWASGLGTRVSLQTRSSHCRGFDRIPRSLWRNAKRQTQTHKNLDVFKIETKVGRERGQSGVPVHRRNPRLFVDQPVQPKTSRISVTLLA